MTCLPITAPVAVFSAPSDPTGTTSSSLVMMGLAIAVTPAVSGNLAIFLSGLWADPASANPSKVKLQLYCGTGTAPANGAAATGTAVGPELDPVINGATGKSPFTLIGGFSGTANTTYWVDLGVGAFGGDAVTVTSLSVAILERL